MTENVDWDVNNRAQTSKQNIFFPCIFTNKHEQSQSLLRVFFSADIGKDHQYIVHITNNTSDNSIAYSELGDKCSFYGLKFCFTSTRRRKTKFPTVYIIIKMKLLNTVIP